MKARKASVSPGCFINVDLDIESAHDLTSLAAELEPLTTVLHRSQFKASFIVRVETLDWSGDADQRIHELCRVVENLSPAGRALWYSATKREFDIGYDAGNGRHLLTRFTLRSDTVGRIARLGATLAVSVYRPDPAEPLCSTPNPTTDL